jgi:SAM-dependent methyltransferase
MRGSLDVNWWSSAACARAFWGQRDCSPYQVLLNDTLDWAAPEAHERWLDLGCGGGNLTQAIWENTAGAVHSVLGLDCAAANANAYAKLRESLDPAPGERIQFLHHNFSRGLSPFLANTFDHAVSGLSISYAESYDQEGKKWTSTAYDRLLAEVQRVIRPGGRFVFSVNVPEPSWARIAWRSLPGIFGSRRSLRRAWRMLRYGVWLKQQARKERFHYFPAAEVSKRLAVAGFTSIEHRLSYCGQAFVFRALKPRTPAPLGLPRQ